jgi:hypothetical protein
MDRRLHGHQGRTVIACWRRSTTASAPTCVRSTPTESAGPCHPHGRRSHRRTAVTPAGCAATLNQRDSAARVAQEGTGFPGRGPSRSAPRPTEPAIVSPRGPRKRSPGNETVRRKRQSPEGLGSDRFRTIHTPPASRKRGPGSPGGPRPRTRPGNGLHYAHTHYRPGGRQEHLDSPAVAVVVRGRHGKDRRRGGPRHREARRNGAVRHGYQDGRDGRRPCQRHVERSGQRASLPRSRLAASPEVWMPWNYRAVLT